MKKITSILISLVFLLNVAFGYTSTIIIKGVSVTVTGEEGSVIEIESKIPEVTGWDVKTGNTTVENDQFIMPAGDVVIEGIIPTTSSYLLTLQFPYFTNEELRTEGEVITVQALNETENYTFTGWEATGLTLTEAQQTSASITFTMPGNAVTLVANYTETGSGIDVTTIPVGAYIAYQPSATSCTVLASDSGYTSDQTYNPSSITSWKVFKNNSGQLDIISSESVGDLTLQGATGYAKAVYTLNQMCSDYVNPTYATSGRNLGYVAGSSMETIDTTTYPLNYGVSGFPYTDTYDTDDRTIINTAVDEAYPLRHSSGYVWLASRNFGTSSSYSNFFVGSLNTSGRGTDYNLYYSAPDGSAYTRSSTCGVRPVISLKSGLKIVSGDGTSENPYVIEIDSTIPTYTITYNANGGSGAPSSTTKAHGGNLILSTTLPTKEGYNFLGWATTSTATSAEYSAGGTFTTDANTTLYAVWEKAWAGWNAPKLGTSGLLTPVNWNGSTWVTTDEANWDYNYEIATAGHNKVEGDGTGKWANAQTSDGSLYVWIPRYTYKITSGEHQDVDSWSSVDTTGTGKIEVKFSNGTTDDTTDGYISHPAFTFGTDKLEGIWVAKYEASRNDATATSVGTGTTVSSKPGVKSWVSTTVSEMYDYAYNLNRTLDSHLMRNSEWGAVAYLTNAIGKIPYINNYYASSSPYVVTGYAGASQDQAKVSGNANSYLWNTANGVKGSSTHNVYGIYDLSGGAWEYVSAYVDNGTSNLSRYASNLVTNKSTKYVEVYPIGTSDSQANNYAAWSGIKGDAVYETSSSYSGSTSWDGDYSLAPYSAYPVFYRGGYSDGTSSAGVFYFRNSDGAAGTGGGFRPVLAIP